METKFTKGEWKWASGDATEMEICITTDERNLNGVGNICEMNVYFDGEMGIEQKANANLIAAATKMYRMIEDLRQMMDKLNEGFNEEAIELSDRAESLLERVRELS
jgi:hypothetical protein